MNAYWSRVCTALALSLLTLYTILGMSTFRVSSKSLIATSHAMTVPVLPVPGLQWTTTGPPSGPPVAGAKFALFPFPSGTFSSLEVLLFEAAFRWLRASIRKAIREFASVGTPLSGHPMYHRWVTSLQLFETMF